MCVDILLFLCFCSACSVLDVHIFYFIFLPGSNYTFMYHRTEDSVRSFHGWKNIFLRNRVIFDILHSANRLR